MTGKKLRIVGKSGWSRQISTSRRGLSAGTAPSCGDPSLLSTHLTTRRGGRFFYHACAALIGPRTALRRLQLTVPCSAPVRYPVNIPALRCELASRSFCVRTWPPVWASDYEPVKAVGCAHLVPTDLRATNSADSSNPSKAPIGTPYQ